MLLLTPHLCNPEGSGPDKRRQLPRCHVVASPKRGTVSTARSSGDPRLRASGSRFPTLDSDEDLRIQSPPGYRYPSWESRRRA